MREDKFPEAYDLGSVAAALEVKLSQQLSDLECIFQS